MLADRKLDRGLVDGSCDYLSIWDVNIRKNLPKYNANNIGGDLNGDTA